MRGTRTPKAVTDRFRSLRPRGPMTWRRVGSVAVAVLLAALTVAGLAQVRLDTSISSFLPAGDPAGRALDEKARAFGGDPIVVLLESGSPRGPLLADGQLPAIVGLESKLAKVPDVEKVYGPATALNQIALSAKNLLAQISGRRDAVRNAADAEARARGADPVAAASAADAALRDFDQRYGRLIVQALPAGLPTLKNPRFVQAVMYEDNGNARPQWQAVAPRPNTVAILVRPRPGLDQGATSRLVDDVTTQVRDAGLADTRVTVSGVPAVTAALSDRAQGEFPLLAALALLVVGLLYFFVPWTTGRRRSRLRPLVVALTGTALTLAAFGWLGRPLSLGVVAFLPILLGIGSDFPLYLAQPARRRRVLSAAAAGAAGFAALAISPLPFVRELGLALALGMVAIVGVAMLASRYLPQLEPLEPPSAPSATTSPPRPWRVRIPALLVALGIAAAGWVALPHLDVEARPDRLAQGLPALQEAEHAEKVIGSSGEVSLVLRGPDALSPEAFRWSRAAEDTVARSFADRLHPVITPAQMLQFLGPDPTLDQVNAAVTLVPPYLSTSVIAQDRTSALMILGIELQDLDEQKALLDGLRAALPAPPPGYTVDVVGLPVAAVQAHDAVSQGRTATNVLAVLFAGLVLLVGLRERRDVGRAVLTVALSTGWVLALAWLVSGSLSPLSVAVGALSTATGCEFAVMLADARRHRRPWLFRSAMLAALAAAAGYLVLAVSGLAILREFGLLLAASVGTSLVAALLVIGVLFPPAPEPDSTADDDPAPAPAPDPVAVGGVA